jgi:hypothetical protein
MAAARVIRARRLSDLAVAHYSSSTSRCLGFNRLVTLGPRSVTDPGCAPCEHALAHFARSLARGQAKIVAIGWSTTAAVRPSRSSKNGRSAFETARRPVDNGRPVDQHWSPSAGTRRLEFPSFTLTTSRDRRRSFASSMNFRAAPSKASSGWSVEKRMQ